LNAVDEELVTRNRIAARIGNFDRRAGQGCACWIRDNGRSTQKRNACSALNRLRCRRGDNDALWCGIETQRVELFLIGGRQTLERAVGIELVERIVATLHAAVEKIAGVRSLAIVGNFREATVDRKIGGRGGVAIVKELRSGAGKAKQIKNIGLRAERHAAERVRQLM